MIISHRPRANHHATLRVRQDSAACRRCGAAAQRVALLAARPAAARPACPGSRPAAGSGRWPGCRPRSSGRRRSMDNGPPCTIAWPTSTPVPKPLTRIRPTRRSSTGSMARACVVIGFVDVQRAQSAGLPALRRWRASSPGRGSAPAATRRRTSRRAGAVGGECARRWWRTAPAWPWPKAPPAPRASVVTPAWPASAATPASYAWWMPGVSMVAAGWPASARAAAATKAVQRRPFDRQQQAGIGAELAGAHHQRADELLGDRFGAGGQRVREQQHRIDAAHFGVHRNRLAARCGDAPSAPCRRRASR